MAILRMVTVAGAFVIALVAAPVAWAGGIDETTDETREYRQPCPACPTCPVCPEVLQPEDDPTWLRAELKGGVLMGVGNTSKRINYGGMFEPTFGVKVWDDLDLEASYLWANNGVDNSGARSGSQNMHCVRAGPRINGDVGPIMEMYGTFKLGYCRADARGSGFSDDNFVLGPGGGLAFNIMENTQLTSGIDLIWFTRNVRENMVITPNAGIRFKF